MKSASRTSHLAPFALHRSPRAAVSVANKRRPVGGRKHLLMMRKTEGHGDQPAAVVAGVPLQRGGGSGQAHAGEGVVVGELDVRQAGHAVRLLVHILPVRAEARRALREGAEQVGVQLVDDLLVHAGLKLPGEERGPHRLLGGDEDEGGD